MTSGFDDHELAALRRALGALEARAPEAPDLNRIPQRAARSRRPILVAVGAAVATLALLLPVGLWLRGSEGPSDTTEPVDPGSSTSTTAPLEAIDWRAYVEGALARAEALYYRPEVVDWGAVRERAWEVLGDDPTQGSAHRAIEQGLQRAFPLGGALGVAAGDAAEVGFFLRPEYVQFPASALELPRPTGRVVAGRVGLLNAYVTTGLGETGRDYASTLHDLARATSAEGVCGWVIDLRDSYGGYFGWSPPMLLGLGPFLGDGVFLTAGGRTDTSEWSYSYEGGQLLVNGDPFDVPAAFAGTGLPTDTVEALAAAARLYTEPFVLPVSDQPIAVLTSFYTGGAGEALLIAFDGRSGTRSFGEPTYGYSVDRTEVYLEDGAALVVTSAVLADRNGRVYQGSIMPDEIVIPLPQTEADEVLDRATQWILAQPACDA